VFLGNQDTDSVVYNRVSPPIISRYIRILPVEWYGHISMRMELYGCPGISRYALLFLPLGKIRKEN